MAVNSLTIAGTVIDDKSDCWVIAEIGQNHQGEVAKAKELFRRAKDAGADAVKLQKRDNQTLFTRAAYARPYDNENSFGLTYGTHREALELDRDAYVELQAYARELNMTLFATAFDIPSADFLADLDMPAFKIASADLTNIPLLRHVAGFGKPVIISTGGGTLADVQRAHEAAGAINSQIAILQCTSSYPAAFEDLDLGVITTYRQRFPDVVVGYSGHDNGIAMAVAAYVLGARIVEKHFTLNRAMKGTDHAFSLEPQGLTKMVRDLRRIRLALGNGSKDVRPSEMPAILKMGKKLVAVRDLPAGHVLEENDLVIKCPGDGLPPYQLDNVLGRSLLHALAEEDDIRLENLGARHEVPAQLTRSVHPVDTEGDHAGGQAMTNVMEPQTMPNGRARGTMPNPSPGDRGTAQPTLVRSPVAWGGVPAPQKKTTAPSPGRGQGGGDPPV